MEGARIAAGQLSIRVPVIEPYTRLRAGAVQPYLRCFSLAETLRGKKRATKAKGLNGNELAGDPGPRGRHSSAILLRRRSHQAVPTWPPSPPMHLAEHCGTSNW